MQLTHVACLLPKQAQPLLSDRRKLYKIMDPRLEGVYDVKAAQKAGQLCDQCLKDNPKSRPTMGTVVRHLVALQVSLVTPHGGGLLLTKKKRKEKKQIETAPTFVGPMWKLVDLVDWFLGCAERWGQGPLRGLQEVVSSPFFFLIWGLSNGSSLICLTILL